MKVDADWAIVAGDLSALIALASAAHGVAEKRFALGKLEEGFLHADPGTATPALCEKARVLGVSENLLEAALFPAAPHAVNVPFVVPSSREALVRAVLVSYAPLDEESWTLDAKATRAVRDAIGLAAELAVPPHPVSDYVLVPAMPTALRGAHIDGASLGAAAFISALALFRGVRVRPGLAITGAVSRAHILPVEGIAEKARAASARGLQLVAPHDVRNLEALIALTLEKTDLDADIEDEVRAAVKSTELGWNGYRWPRIREVLTRTLGRIPDRRPDLQVDVLTRLAAAERHLGRTDASMRALKRCADVIASDEGKLAVPDAPRIRLLRQKAMTLLQTRDTKDARRSARASVVLAKKARMRSEVIASLGAEGLAALAQGDAQSAVALFEESVHDTLLHRPTNAARSRAYLIEALGHSGDRRRATKEYKLALAEAKSDTLRGGRTKEAWVRTSYASALLALGAPKLAYETLNDPSIDLAISDSPLPGLKARRHRALAMLGMPDREGRHEVALRLLETSPEAYQGLEWALRCVAFVNVLYASRARLLRGEEVDRWEESLAALPSGRRIRTLKELLSISYNNNISALENLLREVAML
jgi:tetratricopeptide (TPR) repeat protein